MKCHSLRLNKMASHLPQEFTGTHLPLIRIQTLISCSGLAWSKFSQLLSAAITKSSRPNHCTRGLLAKSMTQSRNPSSVAWRTVGGLSARPLLLWKMAQRNASRLTCPVIKSCCGAVKNTIVELGARTSLIRLIGRKVWVGWQLVCYNYPSITSKRTPSSSRSTISPLNCLHKTYPSSRTKSRLPVSILSALSIKR